MATGTKNGNGTETKPEPKQELARFDPNGPCNPAQLQRLFADAKVQLERALPAQLKKNAERIARCAITEFQKNPELAKCTGLSILSCAMQAAQLGLEIGGVTGQSYMVPYGGKATFQIGYRGMIALAFRSGEVASIYAAVVREKDAFKIQRGTSPGIDHQPATSNAGKVIGAYAVVVYKSREVIFEYMSRDEIEHHRQTYSKQKYSMLWTSAWDEGAKKTVLRRLLKQCPFAADFPAPTVDDDAPADEVILTVPASPDPEPKAIAPTDDGVNEPGQLFPSETDTSAQAR